MLQKSIDTQSWLQDLIVVDAVETQFFLHSQDKYLLGHGSAKYPILLKVVLEGWTIADCLGKISLQCVSLVYKKLILK